MRGSEDRMKDGFADGGYVNAKDTSMMLRPGEAEVRVGRPTQLDRIEVKLDALLYALAEDEPEQEKQFDLDGNEIEQGEDNGGAL